MIGGALSLRTRLVLIAFLAAILPMAVVGVWLANSVSRSAEELLRARLAAALERVAAGIGARWVARRAELLTIGDDARVQAWLRGEGADTPRPDLAISPGALTTAAESVTIRAADGRHRWTILTNPAESPAFTVSFDVFDRTSGRHVGSLDTAMRIHSLLPVGAGWVAGAGTVLAVIDPATGTSLLPLPFDADLINLERFEWSGEHWMTVRRRLHEPSIHLVAAAPILPFAQPFESATRQGLIALLVVTTVAAIVTTLLTRGTTASLRELADAATVIAAGQYGGMVHVTDERDEVGRVARAFNSMSASLRTTLDQLAARQSLAAVGEFAATLAHEVRNPLTALRIDLQRLEEKLPDDPGMRVPAGRALQTLSRLDATVTGALRVARSGRATLARIDLREPLRAAIHDVLPDIQARGLRFSERLPAESIPVMGDSAALYQLFLNLLLNAAQATPDGGRVDVAMTRADSSVAVRVSDSGPGVPAGLHGKMFEPFYTTKPAGTGLGLAIATRITAAHGGRLAIDKDQPAGAVLVVEIPSAPDVTI